MKNKTVKSRIRFLFIYCTAVILAFGAVYSLPEKSLAWFYIYGASPKNVFVTSGDVSIAVERYLRDSDEWADAVVDESGNISDLHFGSIDNIIQLKPENHLYYRLKIPSAAGGNISFSLEYNKNIRNGYNLYTGGFNGDDFALTADEAVYAALKKVEYDETGAPKAGSCFLNFSLRISQSESLGDIDFTEPDLYEMFGGNITETFEPAGEHYYIYIKISPNVNSLIHAVDYMPCIFEFHLKINLEVHDLEGL